MKSILILTQLIFILYFPNDIFAHGGFEKRAGNVIVYVKQTPLSPLIGEEVILSFSLRDEGRIDTGNLSDKNLSNWPVTLSVVDTYYGDESQDQVVFQQEFKTDVNGNFSFFYTFSKENFFDIDLDFKDSKGENLETGFLIQPRMRDTLIKYELDATKAVISFLIGAITILGALVLIFRFKR